VEDDDGTGERDDGWEESSRERGVDDAEEQILQDVSRRSTDAIETLPHVQSLRGQDGSSLPHYDDVHRRQ
jgi:hypothetical protein